ncbi:hypothetical protein DUNSADRAFT_5141 [Dunaliella salina]|uniref:PA domain-containing protein n=1 Tax=Dunaliella salina TaxID=3046 RepID=A0ABQ7H7D9_DUNSA|nr:hypothetical protein DUNSADRAFT_5141 [Dunaliella salina]|eukprot:KAF5842769.1 hypothetical protein DUNSADRAFT_5141 [Dunaliella salina]
MRERIVRIVPALLALLYFALPSTQADVYVLTRSYILEPLPSLQADFGPPISAEGVDGVLRLADPLDACSPFTFTDTKQPWVALISREQRHKSIECTFDLKVRHAEQAGAQAAIVYDDLYESLIIMSKPLEHPDPGIPSVFVSEKAGLLLLRLLQLDEVHVRITPVSAVAWISMVMSAFLGLLAMTIVFSSFYVMRTWSYWLTVKGKGEGVTQLHRNPSLSSQGSWRATVENEQILASDW